METNDLLNKNAEKNNEKTQKKDETSKSHMANNPFGRSGKMVRSPPSGTAQEIPMETEKSATPTTPLILYPPRLPGTTVTPVIATTAGTPPVEVGKEVKEQKIGDKAWVDEVKKSKRGDKSRIDFAIEVTGNLKQFMDSKKNMHTDAHLLMSKADTAVKQVKIEVDALQASVKERDDIIAKLKTALDAKDNELLALRENVKKKQPKRKLSDDSGGGIVATPTLPKKYKNNVDDVDSPRETPGPEGWKKVASRKKERKKPTKTPEPMKPKGLKGPKAPRKVRKKANAVVIGIKDGDKDTYAQILKKIKGDVSLAEVSENATKVRRTKNGDMLVQFKGDSTNGAKYQEMIKGVIGDETTVKALSHEVAMECRNIDIVTSAEEVRQALIRSFELHDSWGDGAIKLRKTYNETQAATFKVPADVANKMIEAGKVKVGWVVCHLRRSQQLLRCFKCFGYNHISKNCKAGADRSKTCWRCGVDGHLARTCKNDPKCSLCSEAEGNKHPTGSIKCKAYKAAKIKAQKWR